MAPADAVKAYPQQIRGWNFAPVHRTGFKQVSVANEFGNIHNKRAQIHHFKESNSVFL